MICKQYGERHPILCTENIKQKLCAKNRDYDNTNDEAAGGEITTMRLIEFNINKASRRRTDIGLPSTDH